jgi:hypothetical protein
MELMRLSIGDLQASRQNRKIVASCCPIRSMHLLWRRKMKILCAMLFQIDTLKASSKVQPIQNYLTLFMCEMCNKRQSDVWLKSLKFSPKLYTFYTRKDLPYSHYIMKSKDAVSTVPWDLYSNISLHYMRKIVKY